jgi:phosphoglycolate phosphatase
VRSAIFDLDGTLADTSGDLIAAANATLRDAGIAAALEPGRDEAVAVTGGRPMLRLALARAGRKGDDDLVDALYPRLLAHYAEAIAVHTRLYDGAEAALALLAEGGWRLGVCTNKPQRLAERLLSELGIAGRFQAVLGADALPVRKPDPRHLTETVLRAGGASGRAVMIGDTVTDRDAAEAAGVPCILVAFGPQAAAVAGLRPTALLEDYADLPELLEALMPFAPSGRAAEATAEGSAAADGLRRPAPRVP